MRQRKPGLIAAMAIVALQAGVSSASGHATVRDAAGRERKCQPASLPKELPDAGTLIDTASLFRMIQSGPAADTADVVLGLLFGESATLPVIRQLEPSGAGPLWMTGLGSALLPQTERKQIWAVRLRIDAKSHRVTALRSVYCPPQTATEGPAIGVETVAVSSGDRLPSPGQKIRIEAEVTLSEIGLVVDVKMLRRSGIAQMDENLMQRLRSASYLPALIDGLPIPSWIRTGGAKLRL